MKDEYNDSNHQINNSLTQEQSNQKREPNLNITESPFIKDTDDNGEKSNSSQSQTQFCFLLVSSLLSFYNLLLLIELR